MKRYKVLGIVGIIIAAYVMFGGTSNDYRDKPELTMLIVGDSLSAAYQIDENKSWTKIIQEKIDENNLNVKVVNISQSGDRTIDALNKHDEHLNVKPDIVIMNIGANDALKKVNISETKDNFKEMIESFKSSKNEPDVVLVNITPPKALTLAAPHLNAYTKIVPEMADKYNLIYIDNFFEDLDSGIGKNKHFLADRLHPSELAQPIIAENIYKKVLPVIEKRHNK